MRSLPLCAALTLLLAACESSTSAPEATHRPPAESSPTDPMTALASSASCRNRCAIPLQTGFAPGSQTMVYAGSETAAVVGLAPAGGFWWKKGSGARMLTPGTASRSEPYGLNGWGQAVGAVITSGGPYAAAWEPDGKLFRLTEGKGGPYLEGTAYAINENSVIVGQGKGRAFRHHYAEGFTYLTPGAGTALDVNYDGQVVGNYISSSGAKRAFLWTSAGGLQDLGTLPGHTEAEAVAISETGIVVGQSYGSSGRRGFMWTAAAGIVALEPDFRPVDVNHWGEVVGTSMDGTACFVWYRGYGMLRLPDNGHKTCWVESINSWGDVFGGTYNSYNRDFELIPGSPTVWTWAANRSRYEGS